MNKGQKVYCFRSLETGTLYVYGSGTYLGTHKYHIAGTGYTSSREYDCVALDNGRYYFSFMDGGIGTKEAILSRFEGLYTRVVEVSTSDEFRNYAPYQEQEEMKVVANNTGDKKPMIIFAKSKDGRVTIAGVVTEIDEMKKTCKVALGLAKQRKSADPVNRKKLARQIARGRATQRPFAVKEISYALSKPVQTRIEDAFAVPSIPSRIVAAFRESATQLAEELASNPLPHEICELYRFKEVV